ncbi:SDR family NAD(P)-dependent oxidoreductase [Dietzia aerolata]|uniref:SDR family NAD(P)-dependent oxidoreductase n=1 Tax=Dietzia aerolata TaxID=595984 RepID=A0ABV5JQ45_9ACTN|nr:SDR family NAD(P)-dependent oxidoreductase [Dietzia aerolata]MBB0969724.1 SDR family NAD(P)-dependent oxidoreductase [Dietzia aerolata]
MSTPVNPKPFDPSAYGPWALVVGGSEGVGAEIAFRLADQGVSSVLVARKLEALEETAAAVRAKGVDCRVVSADLTEADSTDKIAEAVEGLDLGLLILNAGANTYGSEFVESDMAQVQKVIDLNITSPMQIIRRFGPALKARGKGGIVVMGSMAGYLGHADMSIYSAAKAFSRVFVEGLWLEMREYGVDVVEVILGVTRTPAMIRAGLDMDLPGMTVSEPDEVADEVMTAIGNGPVHVLGGEGNVKGVEFTSGTNRGRIVAGAHKRMQALRGE